MTIEPRSLSSTDAVVEFLSEYCTFGPGRVYVLSVMARPRENEAISHGSIPMFREIMTEPGDIRRKVTRLEAIAERFEPEETDDELVFRMYVSANARDVEKSYHQFQKKLLDLKQTYSQGHEPSMDKMERLDREWESMLQSSGNKDDSRFIIDVDTDSQAWFEKVRAATAAETEILTSVVSPNGFHIITEPFNYPQSDVTDMDDVEVKTDGLLFLRLLE